MSFAWRNAGDQRVPQFRWIYQETRDTPRPRGETTPVYDWGQEAGDNGVPRWINRGTR